MKNLIAVILILGAGNFAFGQGAVMTKYFEKYSDNEDFTKVSVSSKMFSLFTELDADTDDERDFLEAISKLKGLKAVVGENVDVKFKKSRKNETQFYKPNIEKIEKKLGYTNWINLNNGMKEMLECLHEK